MSGSGKGLKIFSSAAYKDHEKKPMAQLFWKKRWMLGVWAACMTAFLLSFAAEHLWRYGFSTATWKWMGVYFHNLISSFGLSAFAEIPDWVMRIALRTDAACIAPLLPILIYGILTNDSLMDNFNPHGKDKLDSSSSREATKEDIESMGLLGGGKNVMVLGYLKDKPLFMPKTLSAICFAPPGTGKTECVVLPTILECDTVSMIINDPKPEIAARTSGYRATLGPVFIINWAGQDDPDNGIFYPSWNPLSPSHVPYEKKERDLFVDSLANTLVDETPKDPYWGDAGRHALSGLIHFIIYKIERAKANDYFKHRIDTGTFNTDDANVLYGYYMSMHDDNAMAAVNLLRNGELNSLNYVHVGTWSGIPAAWLGKEASFSMLLDWLTESMRLATEQLEELKRSGNTMATMGADTMRSLFEAAANEAVQYGYSERANSELRDLAALADKTRSSVLSTATNPLNIFKNSAVRERTSHSDFHFADMRGFYNQTTQKWEPITVYLSINQVDIEAVNPINAIFIEQMSRFLISNPPDKVHAGRQLGDKPVLFLLDEMPAMKKMSAIIKGPEVGRSQSVSYLLIGQDMNQINEKYGEYAGKTLLSTSAAKILFRQNSMETAKLFSEMMGNKIKKKTVKGADGKDTEENDASPLFSADEITHLESKYQLVIYEGFPHRPIKADAHYAYKDDALKAKQGMPVANPLPEFLVPAHRAALGYK
jgi:type IV secretion system protein VirD4